MEFIKQYTENGFSWIQQYDNGRERIVKDTHPGLNNWLDAGNIPEERPYTPPPLPSLDEYKAAKIQAIGNECIARIMAVTGSGSVTTLCFDLIYYTSKAAKYINKKALKNQELTTAEQAHLDFLESQENACNSLREYADTLKPAVLSATTYAAVDAVTWE